MQLSKAVGFYLFLQITVLVINVHGQCSWANNTLPTITNGHNSNVDNLKLYSNGLAEGYYDIECDAGYTLNSDIGGRITCLKSGSWSQPLPQCKSMGSCPIATLFTFLGNTYGIHIDRSFSFIFTNGVDDNQALGGSNITIQCADGYKNVGGSLTIICTAGNTWTTFPNCISMTTTAVPPVRCPVTADTWTFPNGYRSDTSGVTVYDDNTATGFIIVSCSSGYVMDAISGGRFTCNNGMWSERPYCTKTGRCSFPTLRAFLNDTSATNGLDISSQLLTSNPGASDEILIGSYISFNCKNGYKNTDGNLNVTCNANGQWSAFPVCTSTSEYSGRCPAKNYILPSVPNGHISNTDNLNLYSDGFAQGYYDIACDAGYTLNPDIGGRITCLPPGSWSQPLPQCNSMGSCSIPALFTFLQTYAYGIRIDRSLSFIFTNGVNNDQALGGSNITIQCADGYKNVGGSLTIICTAGNTWTTFPNCISTTTTAVTPVRCPVTQDIWTFTNGYISNTNGATEYADNTAIGFVIVSCESGYVIDAISGGRFTCNNGVWSARPYCTKTPRCSLPTMKNFINNPSATNGLKISTQHLSTNSDESDEVLIGSYILFDCQSGYTNTDGNLNVVCNANGQWSAFPTCVPVSTTMASGASPMAA